MRSILFFFLITPLFMLGQSGISLSGSSMFHLGQTVLPAEVQFPENETFLPINFESRNNKVTLSLLRGRKFKFGILALNLNISYSSNSIEYKNSEFQTIDDLKTNTKNLIPSVEVWWIFLQRENTFLYTSLGGYGIFSDLNINDNYTYEYNEIIPFLRVGTQLNYGKFFLNPFVSFDLDGISFNEIGDVFEIDLQTHIKNYSIRSGLEFGIMF